MNKISKNSLVDRHMFLSTSNLNFLNEYIADHVTVNNYSEVVREILNSLEVNSLTFKSKVSAIVRMYQSF